jgi:hypothetical protein
MSNLWSIITNRKDGLSKVWKEWRSALIEQSTGPADAGSIPMLGSGGTLDPSFVTGIVPIIQDSMQFVNTNEPHAIMQTASLTALYAVSIYLDALGDGGLSDTLVTSLTWTQPSTNVVHLIQLVLAGNTDNVQLETYPILAKANTPITLSAVFNGAPFHYDVAARLVQMP